MNIFFVLHNKMSLILHLLIYPQRYKIDQIFYFFFLSSERFKKNSESHRDLDINCSFKVYEEKSVMDDVALQRR